MHTIHQSPVTYDVYSFWKDPLFAKNHGITCPELIITTRENTGVSGISITADPVSKSIILLLHPLHPFLSLHRHLDTTLAAWSSLLRQLGQQVGDVIPRVTVQAGSQSLLVEEVGNQTNRPTEHE